MYNVLGIRDAKGAPLPRLCFAQLALTLFIATAFAKKHYVTDTHTDARTHTPTNI